MPDEADHVPHRLTPYTSKARLNPRYASTGRRASVMRAAVRAATPVARIVTIKARQPVTTPAKGAPAVATDERTPDSHDYLERPRDGNGKFARSMDNVRRDAAAAEYWAEHRCSYQEIADRFGYYDRSQAWRGIQSAKRDVALPAVTKMRQSEAEQLDELYLLAREIIDRNHVVVSHGKVITMVDPETGEEKPLLDDGPRLQAIQTALKIRDQYQNLHGLKQPAKVEHSGGVRYEVVGVDPEDLT